MMTLQNAKSFHRSVFLNIDGRNLIVYRFGRCFSFPLIKPAASQSKVSLLTPPKDMMIHFAVFIDTF